MAPPDGRSSRERVGIVLAALVAVAAERGVADPLYPVE
jgi:hypothetical protein